MESFFLLVATTGAIFLMVGLYKPWVTLWWREKQNRRQVINLYGAIALVSLLLYTSLRIART